MEASAANQNVSTSSSVKGASTIKRKRATVPKKPANASHLVSYFFYISLILREVYN